MSVASFVNAGTYTTTAGATTLTPPLPSSPATNNILIVVVSVKATGQTFTKGGADAANWTLGDSDNSNNQSAAWYWRIVDGTQAALQVSWGSSVAGAGAVYQFTGNLTVSPIGNVNKASANASTTATVAAITASANNAYIFTWVAASTAQSIPIFANWNILGGAANSANTSAVAGFGTIGSSGQSSPSLSTTITSANWQSFGIEIKGSGAALTGAVRASQAIAQTLEQYAANPTRVIASQVVAQTLEQYAAVPTNTIVSQVVLQTLNMRSFDVARTNVRASQVVLQTLRRHDQAPTRNHVSQVVLQVLRTRDRKPDIQFATAILRGTGKLLVDYLAGWPLELPQCPNEWDEQSQGNSIPFKPEAGSQKVRRNYSAHFWLSHAVYKFNNRQTAIFKFFYETTLRDGSLAFYWPHPISKVTYTWKFVPKEQPEIDRATPTTSKVRFRLIRIEQVPV